MVLDHFSFYCINFKDNARRERINTRFATLDLSVNFVDPVETTDPRLQNLPIDISNEVRTWAIMLQHIDSIRHFVENTDAEFCVVCEDDVFISKYLVSDMPEIEKAYRHLNLDILLLGYLLPYSIPNNHHFPLHHESGKYKYYGYPGDLWGAQMYMFSRSHAIQLVERYSVSHAIETFGKMPFNPDWTITKYGNKSILFPMVALEEGDTKADLHSEISFHRRCFLQNYRENEFI
jgi:hypothetical protein